MNSVAVFKKLVEESDNIVFFGGAGVSTESGIPDFRSVDGLYSQKFKYPPEHMLSHTFFMSNTEEFFDFYRNKLLPLDAQPNMAHIRLAELEKAGKVKAVITQNVDGLHYKAGSKNVYELHGSIYRNYCMKCKKPYDVHYLAEADGVPMCTCGGIVKPDVVLYEEGLDESVINGAVKAINDADMLIIGGTSLTVYPAASLVSYYRGNKLALINKDATPYDSRADLVINEAIGEVFRQI